MSIRSKMHPGWAQRGANGAIINFSAVYEGDGRLQAISENSIYGDATPCGNVDIAGEFPVEQFKTGYDNWYFVDLVQADQEPNARAILRFPVTLAYRSEPNGGAVAFRYAIQGELRGMVVQHIKNPGAIEWLDGREMLICEIIPHYGRASEAEIAVRQQMLDEHIAAEGNSHWKNYQDAWKNGAADLRRKLARAKGLPDEMTEGAQP